VATTAYEATIDGRRVSASPDLWQRIARSWQRNRAGYLFLAPWLIGFFGLTLGPTIASLYLSFTDYDLLTPAQWTGLANYEYALRDSRLHNALSVTFTYVLWSVPLRLTVALALAMVLDRSVRGVAFYRATFYLPSLLGASVAIAVLWRQIFGSEGLVNMLLQLIFGFSGPSWVSHPDYALWTLIILAIWQFGSPMIIFLAGLRQIPQDLYEASEMDGAGPVRQFFRITLPLLAPVIFFNLVLQTIEAFKAFTQAYIVSGGNGGPVDSTMFYTLYLYLEAFANFRMGYASALAWLLLIIIGIFTAVAFLTSRYWVYYEDEGR
jgi:multiple sugar transport system permease protein